MSLEISVNSETKVVTDATLTGDGSIENPLSVVSSGGVDESVIFALSIK